MKILVTGRGTSGSWKVRAEQLGRAIGASVQPMALDVAAFDLVIVVKRTPADLIARIRAAGVPMIWDVVDGWPQPEGNAWERFSAMTWLCGQFQYLKPDGIVAATRAMAEDCSKFGVPVLALPHHARPGLRRADIRPSVRVLGYEGAPAYIEGWRRHIEHECRRRGLTLLVNPPDLGAVDVVLALRDATGYAPRHWKSNVKLANAQAVGLPIICSREKGYQETASGAELWADTPAELTSALDVLQSMTMRQEVSAAMCKVAPSLESTAATYAKWLRDLACVTARRS